MWSFVFHIWVLQETSQAVQVSTKYGKLIGKEDISRSGRRYYSFRGVPYAKPPIGNLRFKDPEPVGKWKGVRNATYPEPMCIQSDYFTRANETTGSEDCLYLSLYTSKVRRWLPPALVHTYRSAPVIVYFHGGCFETEDSQSGLGADYFLDEDIVIVMANYRLGALGFLSFEDVVLPGNFGLKDQLLALEWVRDNIAAFGGDPQSVTIMGVNSGGVSVNLHLLSPLSKGLFQRAISISGSALSPRALATPGLARQRAQQVAKSLGCSRNTTEETVDCLRNTDAADIVSKGRHLIRPLADGLCFYTPVVDRQSPYSFLPDTPRRLTPSPVPWLSGFSSAGGLLKTAAFALNEQHNWDSFEANFSNYVRSEVLFEIPTSSYELIVDEIRHFYLGNKPLSENSLQNLTNLHTDIYIYLPMLGSWMGHTNSVYVYYLDYVGRNTYQDLLGARRMVNGSCYNDEKIYLWNQTTIPEFSTLTGEDLALSKNIITLLKNFAENGNPSRKNRGIQWEEWNVARRYLHINSGHARNIKMRKNLLPQRTEFWLRHNVFN